MPDDPGFGEMLDAAVKSAGDALDVPITIADPEQDDTPLVYVNPAFEKLTLYKAAEVIGRNCRFLQGDETDRTVTDELADTCRNKKADTYCLVNYRKDGTAFFNLVAIQPISITRAHKMLMGCQFAFTPTQTAGTLARTCAMVDRAQRQVRHGARTEATQINTHDTFRLDTVAMRFEAAFVRINDQLLKSANGRMLSELALGREHMRYPRDLINAGPGELAETR
ncbi:PAS domain-containing protein [uncultured Roseobacter sp.]|uniref:PAS domain-containing protein n=1 Tax=uncultured Roseobacter sp. TaxID=114847 RepID=UPI00260D5E5F|nr:PAS domain-containing protein [uncultured Roseobacter sp.]